MTSTSPRHAVPGPPQPDNDGVQDGLEGPRGNERLTAWAGAALFVLLAIEGVTILQIHSMIYWHEVVGIVLIGPLALKVGSTGYRFARYYTRNPAYRRSGPPQIVLRVLAPFLLATTAAVFATGLALLVLPDWHHYTMGRAHKAAFILWIDLAAVHVLAYVWRVPRLMLRDVTDSVSGRGTAAAVAGNAWVRVGLLAASGVLGVVLAKFLI